MQTPPPPNDPFSPLIEAWQQAFLKTLHDPQAAESLWRGWNQLAGNWANASPFSASTHGSAASPASPASESPAATDAPASAAASASGAGVAEFHELARRIEQLEHRLARLEAKLATRDIA
jgi:hypothetical protein